MKFETDIEISPKLIIIVAIGKQNQIGFENRLPWYISEDLKKFKKTTMGHGLLMGRKTFDSIGRPLPGRVNIVLTRQKEKIHPGIEQASSVEDALKIAAALGIKTLFSIGGAAVYRETLANADAMYLSKVDYDGAADCFFPEVNWDDWQIISSEVYSETDQAPAWTWLQLERLN